MLNSTKISTVLCTALFAALGFASANALAQHAGPIHDGDPPGSQAPKPQKPGEDDLTEYTWFPGDPSWLECERVGGEEYPYTLRIGTGSALDPYGLTRDAYGNTISVEEVWLQGLGDVAFDWYSNPDPIGIVIVKSGAGSVVYYYEDEPTWEGHDLLAREPWEPSHLTFCWAPYSEPPNPPPVCDWVDETGWGEGFPYNVDEQGNWGTYTPYPVIIDGVEYDGAVIWAGQHLDAGVLMFQEHGDEVTITIVLHETWRFAPVAENVKVEAYDVPPPDGNPVPGAFGYKATAEESPFTIVVPLANFYGVHLDLEWADCD